MRHTTTAQISHAIRKMLPDFPAIVSVTLQRHEPVIQFGRSSDGSIIDHEVSRVALMFSVRKRALSLVGGDETEPIRRTLSEATARIMAILSPDGAPLALEIQAGANVVKGGGE